MTAPIFPRVPSFPREGQEASQLAVRPSRSVPRRAGASFPAARRPVVGEFRHGKGRSRMADRPGGLRRPCGSRPRHDGTVRQAPLSVLRRVPGGRAPAAGLPGPPRPVQPLPSLEPSELVWGRLPPGRPAHPPEIQPGLTGGLPPGCVFMPLRALRQAQSHGLGRHWNGLFFPGHSGFCPRPCRVDLFAFPAFFYRLISAYPDIIFPAWL